MVKKGLIVPPGGRSILSMAPGRSATLKLLGCETGDSIMLFEETAPAGTETTFHLHRDSDEVAYVLSGEITFKIGDEVTVGGPGTCAFLPRGVPHAWKNTGARYPSHAMGRRRGASLPGGCRSTTPSTTS